MKDTGTLELPCDMAYLRLRAVECGDCLEWNRALVQGKYPVVTFRVAGDDGVKVQRQFYVRHLVWQLVHQRRLPKGQRIVTTTNCDNDRCIAEDHVVVASKAKIASAVVATGVFQTAAFRARVAAGRQHSRKLSDAGVEELRNTDQPIGALARKLGVSRTHARLVRIGQARVDWSNPFAVLQAAAT